jgi:serine protease DegQ
MLAGELLRGTLGQHGLSQRQARKATAIVIAGVLLVLGAACTGGDDEAGRTTTPATTGPEPVPALEAGADTAGTDTASSNAAATDTTSVEPVGDGAADTLTFDDIPVIVERTLPSVVAILVAGDQGQGEGSGVIWSEDGAIVTNNHVVQGASELVVALSNGERVAAEVVGTDPLSDLALLQIDRSGLPAATFAKELPRVGELAIALGNPLGLENTVSAGIVSALGRVVPQGGPALVDLIQTDASISPGNSGGALVNGRGEVIGINVAYLPPQQTGAVAIGFAIPSPTVKSVVEKLRAGEPVEHAFLGVNLSPAAAAGEAGLAVVEVTPGSPADEAGIRPGDELMLADGEPLNGIEDLLTLLRQHSPGDELVLTVLRNGEQLEITVVLGNRPAQ